MPTNKKGYIRIYTNKLIRRERANRAFRCCSCFSTKTEFAHVEKTEINGRGRGKLSRARDIRDNPNKYICLCHECHILYDRKKGE